MKPVLSMKDVSFSYAQGRDEARVRDITLEVQAGQLVLLCGPSGCGKTTLTRLANGLAPHFYEGALEGEVRVCGLDVARAELWETAHHVGSVFQNPKTQFYNVDVRGEVSFCCENLGMPPDEVRMRTERAVASFSLSPLLHRSLFELSGGQKQRIACASSTAAGPELVVLDEPSGNLDFPSMRLLRDAIETWKREGKAVLIAEHRLHYLHGLIDRVLYVSGGRIEQQWTGEEFGALDAHELADRGLRVRCIDDAFSCAPHANGAMPRPEAAEKGEGKAAVRVEHLSVDRRTGAELKRVLDIAELELAQRSITALVGANGAGKSTFAEALVGLNRCKGTVHVKGRELSRKSRSSSCFMVMQDVNHQLFCDSVLDEVMLSMRQGDEKAARDILEAFDLGQFEGEHPLSLSGGQRQRVALACALASERDVIVYDEPTSGLDLAHMRQVASTIRHMRDMGATQIVVTHDPELIMDCCTHVIVLDEGEIAESYPLDETTVTRLQRYFSMG